METVAKDPTRLRIRQRYKLIKADSEKRKADDELERNTSCKRIAHFAWLLLSARCFVAMCDEILAKNERFVNVETSIRIKSFAHSKKHG